MIVHVRHLRIMNPVYCVAGTKLFFTRHGLDWRLFCKTGLPEEVLIATGDPMAIALVRAVNELRDRDE